MKAALALLGVLAVAVAAPAADDPPALADLLAQVGKYVRGFQHDFATVLSDESYQQRETYSAQITGKEKDSRAERVMQSEMLFLWMPDEREWLAVRNVLSVDRKPVPDSRARLEQWLANSTPGAMGRLRNLRDEGARFNIGRLIRNTSDPTLALKVVDPAYQARFAFTLAGSELINGVAVLKLAFVEREQTPTMISVDGHAVTSRGAVWVTPSGIVMQTRLELTDPKTLVDAAMLVFYGREGKLGGWVPVRMDEEYSQHRDEHVVAPLLKAATNGVRLNGQKVVIANGFRETITCSATYTNYRRFETSARIVPPRFGRAFWILPSII
jgi:hypothetical protein